MTLALQPEAVADVRAARDRYVEVTPALGAAFGEDLDRLLARLVAFPRSARTVDGQPGVRRAALRRFPYAVFYVLTEDADVILLRVMHTARSPDRAP